jgi:predicted component of viral defense system (DUF524 family)
MISLSESRIDCLSPAGKKVAVLRITPAGDGSTIAHDPSSEAMQLHENGRYWCELVACDVAGAHLQCSLFRARVPGQREMWLMETSAHAGVLRIDLLDKNDLAGTAWLEVISRKLDAREHYRVMLNDISARMAGLLHDLRSSSTTPLVTSWSNEPGVLQQQLAFVCELMETPAFHLAIQRILDAPHRALQREPVMQPITKTFRQDGVFARQVASVNPRLPTPAQHPLAAHVQSVPARITASQRVDDFDTPENQFVKFALAQLRDFLGHAAKGLRANGADWQRPALRAERNVQRLSQWLAHSFFARLSPLRSVPLGSAALQRKAGYREVLQTWLRFGAHAQMAWDGGDDLFHAGQRDTAQLYEYWLFFVLLDWFCTKFDVAQPPAQSLIERSAKGWLLRLKHGEASAPIIGTHAGVAAQFQYNRTFAAPRESWTTAMRPDFTFTFWPASLTQGEAMSQGRLIHLHFDAKYRVDKPVDMLSERGANRDDLLKMHAYRDAIHHTTGAFVLFPGNGEPALLRRNGDALPSLGAFGVLPVAGEVQGLLDIAAFVDRVLQDRYNRSHAHQLRN